MAEPTRDERWVRDALGELTDPPGPWPGPELRARAAARMATRRRTGLALAAAIALGGLALSLALIRPGDDSSLRARGGHVDPALHLDVLIEDAGGPRRPDGDVVPAGAAVLFRVRTRDGGHLCLDEATPGGTWDRVAPRPGMRWHVGPGEHLLADAGTVLAFRTDHGAGVRAYRASVSADDPGCARPDATAELRLEWRE